MRAVVIGGGNAGSNLAIKLCEEKHDVVMIDRDAKVLAELEAQLDILTLQGPGSSPEVLREAELGKADLVVAVTDSDDVNILACCLAKRAGVPYKVARITHAEYMNSNQFFNLKDMGIDLAINPLEECAQEIVDNLHLPGVQEVIGLIGNRVFAVGFRVTGTSPLLGATLKEFPRPELLKSIRFIALLRKSELIIPRGDTHFFTDDEVYAVGRPEEIHRFLSWARPDRAPIDRIIIAGGSGLGASLASRLEKERTPVVLIESDERLATECAESLKRTTVIGGNPLADDTLAEADFTENTAFIASTGSDENNIISCLLAQKHGARLTIAQVSDPKYVHIINSLSNLDRAVSTHLSMINAILHYIRGRNIEAAYLLQMLPGELLEVNLTSSSGWTGKQIRQLRVPKGTTIATVLRDGAVHAATGDLVLAEGDRLVVFSTPNAVRKIKAVFQK